MKKLHQKLFMYQLPVYSQICVIIVSSLHLFPWLPRTWCRNTCQWFLRWCLHLWPNGLQGQFLNLGSFLTLHQHCTDFFEAQNKDEMVKQGALRHLLEFTKKGFVQINNAIPSSAISLGPLIGQVFTSLPFSSFPSFVGLTTCVRVDLHEYSKENIIMRKWQSRHSLKQQCLSVLKIFIKKLPWCGKWDPLLVHSFLFVSFDTCLVCWVMKM